ncbi:hypothetical protein [Spirillospora albida]|uniref:hypothetical protein n=1 Tax=Spirillospora albida TaxID=58123 RepID=UPI0004C26EAD|nr:hypothetical protein [Spirillospora albida]
MRNRVVRSLAGGLKAGMAVLAASGLLSACGTLGGNSDAVCADTKKAFQQFVTQVRGVPATDAAQWRQATERLAGRLDALAADAEDAELEKALKSEADALRAAAPGVGTGDVSRLNTVLTGTPKQIGDACA